MDGTSSTLGHIFTIGFLMTASVATVCLYLNGSTGIYG